MFNLHAFLRCTLALLLLAVLQLSPTSQSEGAGCLPGTPCPCAADGQCRPKRDSWGHYETRWRAWPGEPSPVQPTPADAGAKTIEQELQPFEAPLPEQEDLRGPAKDMQKVEAAEEASARSLPELRMGASQAPSTLPVVAPANHPVPSSSDDPPALPSSLRQAAEAMQQAAEVVQEMAKSAQPAETPQQTVQASVETLAPAPRPVATDAQLVQPVAWQTPAIELVNPASAAVVLPKANSTQQAIYYEISDQEN